MADIAVFFSPNSMYRDGRILPFPPRTYARFRRNETTKCISRRTTTPMFANIVNFASLPGLT
jgi:hypothetical protein